MKRTISEFLGRVNQTYTQHSKDLRYGEVVMNELYDYDEDAFRMNNGKGYDVYNDETYLSILLQALEEKWKEDGETIRATFLILYYEGNLWARESFDLPAKILTEVTAQTKIDAQMWVVNKLINNEDAKLNKPVYRCIFVGKEDQI